MYKYPIFIFLLFRITLGQAQLVEVQADYNGVGDCIFGAHNNAKTPMFLNIDFADLQNTTFNETLPYVKKLDPGFNSLFTLERYLDADVPRFNYEMKSFRSNPTPNVDLDFPYLLPFAPGTTVKAFDLESIAGFWGSKEPGSWVATGFKAAAGTVVYASRKGQIVEIAGTKRNDDTQTWYNTWANAITLLQPDGTLITYKNVIDKNKKWQVNEWIHAGEKLGEVAPGASAITILIYHNRLGSDDLLFVIPQFVTDGQKSTIVNSAQQYEVAHPNEIRGLEMTKRERKKILGK